MRPLARVRHFNGRMSYDTTLKIEDQKMTQPVQKHGVRYPWDGWFALGSFRLVQGEHFHGLVHGMVQTARQAASARGLRIKVKATSTDITITVVE